MNHLFNSQVFFAVKMIMLLLFPCFLIASESLVKVKNSDTVKSFTFTKDSSDSKNTLSFKRESVLGSSITSKTNQFLWQQAVMPKLSKPLWRTDPYDSGHFLMVPLHAAFASQHQSWIKDFDSFFQRFVADYNQNPKDYTIEYTKDSNRLSQLHFLYLASEYLTLAKKNNHSVDPKLSKLVLDLTIHFWQKPAWQWRSKDYPWGYFNGGMSERLKWKLSHKNTSETYYRGIIDEELFIFAIAGDLKYLLGDNSPKVINDVLAILDQVIYQEIRFTSKNSRRWFLQPGVWADHPEYAYAGWSQKLPNLPKKIVQGIAEDSSHAHRWPLWLKSFQNGFQSQKQVQKVNKIKQLRDGLAAQFVQNVLVSPSKEFPFYRTKNFMDGHNGLYRYEYHRETQLLTGYGSFQLSRTLSIGWWSFLPSKKIKSVYCHMASNYINNNKRQRQVNYYQISSEVGIDELINRLACQMANEF